jgi:Flp pilus assembly protein TadG
MNHHLHGLRNDDRGQILIQVALSLIALALFLGLATDVGQMYSQRRQMQLAANAGALAGARELCLGKDESEAVTIAERSANPASGSAQVTAVAIGNRMTVTTTVTTRSIFTRFVGLETTNIIAIAQAACPTSACNAALVATTEDVAAAPGQ